MRRLPAALVLAFAAIVAPASAAQRCTLPGATTIARNGQARVFSVPGRGATTLRYFGCLLGRRPYLLAADLSPRANDRTHTKVSLVRLAGSWVGWHATSSSDFGVGAFAESVEVRSLAGARRRLSIPVTSRPLTSFRILADGTAAWVLSVGDYREIDAVAHDTTVPSPIAYTRGIDSASVRITPTSVSWTQNGTARSAPLVAPAPPPATSAIGPQGMDARFGDCGTLVPASPSERGHTAARQLAPGPDGSIVAAGTTTSGHGAPQVQDTFVITRFTRDGRFDPAFGDRGVVQTLVPRPKDAQSAELTAAAVQPDGKVIIAGFVRQHDPNDGRAIVYRFNADGTPDASFGTGGIANDAIPATASADIRALALTADGSILVAGQRDARFYLARLRSDGALDTAFGGSGLAVAPGKDVSLAQALVVEPDGTIFAGGQSASEPMLIRFARDGTALSGDYQGPPAAAAITALAALPDGGVIAAGAASNVVSSGQLFLGRYTPAGAPDASFGDHGFVLDPQVMHPRDVAVAPDGSLVASASFYLQPGGYSGSGLVRYSAAGARDTNFGFRGALGGVSSFGLDTGGVLLDPTAGTAYAAQQNGGGFGITRFALGAPATIAVASESSVCALAVAGKLGPLVRTRKLDVSLRLRAPGRLRIRAVASVGGRSVAVGQVTVLRPFIEGAVATIGVSAAATRLLRGAKSARLKITAGAPGAASTTSTITLRR